MQEQWLRSLITIRHSYLHRPGCPKRAANRPDENSVIRTDGKGTASSFWLCMTLKLARTFLPRRGKTSELYMCIALLATNGERVARNLIA